MSVVMQLEKKEKRYYQALLSLVLLMRPSASISQCASYQDILKGALPQFFSGPTVKRSTFSFYKKAILNATKDTARNMVINVLVQNLSNKEQDQFIDCIRKECLGVSQELRALSRARQVDRVRTRLAVQETRSQQAVRQ